MGARVFHRPPRHHVAGGGSYTPAARVTISGHELERKGDRMSCRVCGQTFTYRQLTARVAPARCVGGGAHRPDN